MSSFFSFWFCPVLVNVKCQKSLFFCRNERKGLFFWGIGWGGAMQLCQPQFIYKLFLGFADICVTSLLVCLFDLIIYQQHHPERWRDRGRDFKSFFLFVFFKSFHP